MSGFIRKVKTASDATAVQIMEKRGGVRRILEHVGSAQVEVELVVLVHVAHEGCMPGSWSWIWAWTPSRIAKGPRVRVRPGGRW